MGFAYKISRFNDFIGTAIPTGLAYKIGFAHKMLPNLTGCP
jgi:hypothetical protein